MKEILIYAVSGIASLIVLGYTVHMFIGGLVSEKTEQLAIAGAVLLGAAGIALLVWDVSRRRRSH